MPRRPSFAAAGLLLLALVALVVYFSWPLVAVLLVGVFLVGHAGARRRTLTGALFAAARLSATGRAIRTGHAGRRAKNIIVGRALARAGFWRALWGGRR